MRTIRSGKGYAGSEELSAWFGVGARDQVDRLRILWPRGGETVLAGVETNRAITVREF